MEKIKMPAFMEHGHWKMFCPVCKNRIFIDLVTDTAVCSYCYPSMNAMAFKPIEGGLLEQVPHVRLREKTRKQAEQDGCLYSAEYPAERVQIEAVMRERPTAQNMNWYYEGHPYMLANGMEKQTVEDLIAENEGNGVDMKDFVLPELNVDSKLDPDGDVVVKRKA